MRTMILSISNKFTIQKTPPALFHPKPLMILLAVINNKFSVFVHYLSVKTEKGTPEHTSYAGNVRPARPVVSAINKLLNFWRK